MLTITTRSTALSLLFAAPSVAPAVALTMPTTNTITTTTPPINSAPRLRIVPLEDIRSGSPAALSAATDAFTGRQSLGALGVRVPGFSRRRRDVLRYGARLALDPSASSERVECATATPGARVAPGWSGTPGRENHPIQSGFYANLREELASGVDDSGSDGNCRGKSRGVDEVFGPNLWPKIGSDGGAAQLPPLRQSVGDAGGIMYDVVLDVLDLAGAVASQADADRRGFQSGNGSCALPDLRALAESSPFLPTRLAYYDANYSREDEVLGYDGGGGRADYWLPWHIDFNLATAFSSAMWLDERSALAGGGVEAAAVGEKSSAAASDADLTPGGGDGGCRGPEQGAGLLLRSAAGDVVPAALPDDVVLVQLGAYAQIVTGGLLRAGPHAVGKTNSCGVDKELGRISFGVFVYAPWNEVMRPERQLQSTEEDILCDDFRQLMKKAYTGDTVLDGYRRFEGYMNSHSAAK